MKPEDIKHTPSPKDRHRTLQRSGPAAASSRCTGGGTHGSGGDPRGQRGGLGGRCLRVPSITPRGKVYPPPLPAAATLGGAGGGDTAGPKATGKRSRRRRRSVGCYQPRPVGRAKGTARKRKEEREKPGPGVAGSPAGVGGS